MTVTAFLAEDPLFLGTRETKRRFVELRTQRYLVRLHARRAIDQNAETYLLSSFCAAGTLDFLSFLRPRLLTKTARSLQRRSTCQVAF